MTSETTAPPVGAPGQDTAVTAPATAAVAPAAAPVSAPVAFVVTLPVKPGREAAFLALLGPVLDAMREEPTFVNAILNVDPEDPGRFMIYETWADLDELVAVQLKRPYRQAYEAALPDLLRTPRTVATWTPVRTDFALAGPARAPA